MWDFYCTTCIQLAEVVDCAGGYSNDFGATTAGSGRRNYFRKLVGNGSARRRTPAAAIANLTRTEAHEVFPAKLTTPGASANSHQEFPGDRGTVIGRGPDGQFQPITLRASCVNRVQKIPNAAAKPMVAVAAPQRKKTKSLRNSLQYTLR